MPKFEGMPQNKSVLLSDLLELSVSIVMQIRSSFSQNQIDYVKCYFVPI